MLTFLGRNIPGLKVSILFESFEWKGIYCRIFETPKPPKKEPDLDTVLSQIAKLVVTWLVSPTILLDPL
ncbi:hypothetical protein IQA49_10385 [Leptospira borgpetersenii serovar Ballum]|uniref:Uncharacterized protein n=3 Tax=Leptospira borgpetersenii TaxID=174 RepID=M3HIA1_LEPBO|nr:Uncharacterized protein LB4E_1653 [Leptospira borgpetersenii str. 4E]EKP14156.1 hypothetical protein LEP1GSC128_2900 [Leptospira borgpetersenii str. 200801926]EKQ90765.1 hypothetical protein LEP1GSC101_0616 [Leptospira borgpetersenii str. UI 09149]EKR00167.1 hypothetical protein LEP1GSC121_3836 [Leptospira borgpetersenii serovar Castellonis str. 200801910]EMF97840.1 hypothetical protein LEP1GSC123_4208 [Leptospira borgpetersenii str. 200701203]EMK12693.1 hypothetical protein LEP1GSC066_3642